MISPKTATHAAARTATGARGLVSRPLTRDAAGDAPVSAGSFPRARPPGAPAVAAVDALDARPPVVAAREVVLEEHHEHDVGVAAAHLLQRELRLAGLAVAPRDRGDRVGVPAHD